jgi:hypothetical protein
VANYGIEWGIRKLANEIISKLANMQWVVDTGV